MRYTLDDDTIEKLDIETAKRMVSSCLRMIAMSSVHYNYIMRSGLSL